MEENKQQTIEELVACIEDRKKNSKEGSYTDYLFTKGLDKILKKVGEEATEVVIAAKNPDRQELIYESADLLYHLAVLWVQQGISYQDIKEELASREGLTSKLGERKTIVNR